MSKENSPVPHPKISIVIPVYNGSDFLAEAIDSALAQDYDNFEVIVVNDGSNDGGKTEKIALSYGKKIRYFSKPNGGVATALNLGIEKMTGDYFSWLSHDDLYYPYKLSSQFAALEGNDLENIIVYSGYDIINEHGEYLGDVAIADEIPASKRSLPLYVLFRGVLNGCELLIPKSFFTRFGMFDSALPSTQDYALWFQFMKQPGTRLAFCPVHGVKSRHHANQGTNTISDHFSRCSRLWISMMEQTAPDQRKALYGNEYAFFKRIADRLEQNFYPYTDAVNFARKEQAARRVEIEQALSSAKISVILAAPGGDHGKITETLQCLIAQTRRPDEVILLSEKPEKIILPDNAGDLTLKRIAIPDSSTRTAAWNQGLHEAMGDFAAFLAPGDLWTENELENRLRFLFENGSGAVCALPEKSSGGIRRFLPRTVGAIIGKLPLSRFLAVKNVLPDSGDVFPEDESESAAGTCFMLQVFRLHGLEIYVLPEDSPCHEESQKTFISNTLHAAMFLKKTSTDDLESRLLEIDLLNAAAAVISDTLPENHPRRLEQRKVTDMERLLEREKIRYSNLLNTAAIRWANKFKRLLGRSEYR